MLTRHVNVLNDYLRLVMTKAELINNIKKKKSFLCIGLDPDIKKIPSSLLQSENPVFEFNRQIIDATCDYCVAYKPNIAFYEALGKTGWDALEKTIQYIPPGMFSIADAKRGDIGNTSKMYARAFFENLNFDAITVSPYMGGDSVKPFLEFSGKWAVVLAATSNSGAEDFQMKNISFDRSVKNEIPLYEAVIRQSLSWGNDENIMFVAGATRPEMLEKIRHAAPDHFLLVPGVGTQGGTLESVWKYGANDNIGLLVNVSRSVLYASGNNDFASCARKEAQRLQSEMESLLMH